MAKSPKKPIKESTHLEALKEDRYRLGKAHFTPAERIDRLSRILDGALCEMEILVVRGKATGTGAAATIISFARAEIDAIRMTEVIVPTGENKMAIEGFNPSMMLFNGDSEGESIEA